MQIISDFKQDTQTQKPKPGSYEWWYFDAQSKDGFSLVVIFYEGNPFSRRYIRAIEKGYEDVAEYFPAISISVYKDGIPIFYSFDEVLPDEASYGKQAVKGRVRGNTFEGKVDNGVISYKINLYQQVANGDKLKGELNFFGKTPQKDFGNSADRDHESAHCWNLILPSCRVSGKLKIDGLEDHNIDFEGIGYHDHNIGHEPMKESFDEWYWGRYHFEDYTLIYYLMNIGRSWEKYGWLFDHSGNLLQEISELKESDYSYSKFGLYSARKVEFRGEALEGLLQKEHVSDSGPFYQRFEGNAFIKTKEGIQKGEGISEYIRPGRIYSKLFWPLVNMRISYPGNVHWVQKNARLYRWTW